MAYIFGIVTLGLTMIPTFIALIMMQSNSGISKVKLQKIAKWLFFYTLARSFVWIIAFIKVPLQLLGILDWRSSLENSIILGINMVDEIFTAYWTLQVVRLTNQYLVWINRKMARGVTEEDFKYNC